MLVSLLVETISVLMSSFNDFYAFSTSPCVVGERGEPFLLQNGFFVLEILTIARETICVTVCFDESQCLISSFVYKW